MFQSAPAVVQAADIDAPTQIPSFAERFYAIERNMNDKPAKVNSANPNYF